ncbi:MAG: DUF6505 family protein [Halofilum sp. (in: g-proteobacteria)]|nr:DUF6505 family protein [Halofilum sp. (in: g-proteobacteria)]
MRLLRILRLDESDAQIYFPVAAAGEPAVPGTFMFTFSDSDPAGLAGCDAEAFRRGFLGLDSLGWGTLVTIGEATEAERRYVLDRLAHVFVEHFGAPDRAAALAQAEQELAFVDRLCRRPTNTILSLERRIDNDEVSEQFSTHAQKADWEAGHPVVRIVPATDEE